MPMSLTALLADVRADLPLLDRLIMWERAPRPDTEEIADMAMGAKRDIEALLLVVEELTARRDLGGTLAPTDERIEEIRGKVAQGIAAEREHRLEMVPDEARSVRATHQAMSDLLSRIDVDRRNYAILAELWKEVVFYADGGMTLLINPGDGDDLLTRFKNAFNFE